MLSQECTFASHRLPDGDRAFGIFRAVMVGMQEAVDAQ
jgi:hypothetical protein